jgi:hypothetical protein
MAITFVTTTSYGTWLPGEMRGYVRKGHILPGDPQLLQLSRKLLKSQPVYFTSGERARVFTAIVAACSEFGYRLSNLTIEWWHLHWIMFHGDDPIEKVVGRLKTRMRQALAAARFGRKVTVPSRSSIRAPLSKLKNTLRGTLDV